MKKCHILATAFVAAALTTSAQAQEKLSYSYAELNYVSISNGSRFDANIQYEVKPQIYIFGGYSRSEFDVLTVSGTIDAGSLGAGYYLEVSPGIDAFGELGYMMGTLTVDLLPDTDINGIVGAIGVRGFVMPKVEAEGSVSLGPDDFGGLNLIGRYYFHNSISVGGGIIEGELGVGLRANF